MKLRLAHGLLFVCLLTMTAIGHATNYEITTTLDGSLADGKCTLREAVEASTTQQPVNECVAGTANNKITLQQGTIYMLDAQLDVGGATDEDNDPIPTTIRITIPNPENGEPAIIDMTNAVSRAFRVHADSRLILDGLHVRNGDARPDNGGLILSEGNLTLENGSTLSGGQASLGGLIYATNAVSLKGGASLENGVADSEGGAVYLHGGASFSVDVASISDNTATGNGGALALAADFVGSMAIEQLAVSGNISSGGSGGGFYIRGNTVLMDMRNASFLGNEAGGGAGALDIDVDTSSDTLLFGINNSTFADNSSTGSATVTVLDSAGGDLISNSVIVGDRGGADCGGLLADGDPSTISLRYSFLGQACDTPSEGAPTPPVTPGYFTMTILANDDGACPQDTTDLGACDPADLDPFPGYLPALNGTTPLNNGNPDRSADAPCEPFDQRNVSRLIDSCDAGAIEFAVARRADDEFTIIRGRPEVLPVAANDLGDTSLDCRRVTTPLTPVLPDHQSNAPGDTDLDNDNVEDSVTPAGFDVDDCVQVTIAPSRPGSRVIFVEDPDQEGNVLASYSPGSDYHGQDQFAYRINSEAFEATRNNVNVEGVVNVNAQPASGLTEPESVDQLGLVNAFAIVWLMIAGMQRRYRFRIAPFLLVLFSVPAGAADIQVNTLSDNNINGDGFCTLREALYSAVDDLVNLERACTNGQDGRDTVILPRGCIILDPSLGPLVVNSAVTVQGEGAHGIDSSSLPDGSECSPNDESNSSWTPGTIIVGPGPMATGSDRIPIFDAISSLRLQKLSLFNGNNPGDGGAIEALSGLDLDEVELFNNVAGEQGGAIYLRGQTQGSQDVLINRSYFLNNTAQIDGGALSTNINAPEYQIIIQDTTFEGNRSETTAGALDFNLSSGEVSIVNSLFTDNSAAMGSGAIDLKQVTGGVNIINATIVRNTGGDNGGLDLGEQVGDARSVRMSNSIYAANYVWDAPPGSPGDSRSYQSRCSSAVSEEPFVARIFNLFSSGSVTFGTDCESEENEDTPNENGDDATAADATIDGWMAATTARNFPAGEPDFIPPTLAVQETASEIVDSGNDAPLQAGLNSPGSCRLTDLRGLTRSSGTACDRGAYEVQSTSAQDDSGENASSGRVDAGFVIIDVLANDSTDPVAGKEIIPTSINIPPGSLSDVNAGVAVVNSEATDEACQQGQDCVVRYDPEDPTPLSPDSGDETPVSCAALDAGYEETFTYTFQADDDVDNPPAPEVSNSATVTVTMENVGPVIQNREVWAEPAETVVLELDIEDSFGGEPVLGTMRLSEEPEFAARDEFGAVVGTGVKFNTPAPGYITYVHGDTTKRFTDSFQVSVRDSCGAESSGGRITVRFEQIEASGGDLLSGGAGGMTSLLLLLGFGSLRRRISH